ncbi:hypothetical protein [Phenylobacterium sp.]|uniref:hypothetical protein n=1 Tax=Phenylobacterium sp. TaxID=1871053 RepID=UPI00301D711A
MKTPLFIGLVPNAIVNNANRFMAPVGSASGSSTAIPRVPICEAGTLSRLKVRLGTELSGGGQYVFTLMKNNAAESMAVTLTSGEQSETDTVNTVAVGEGDDIMIRCTPTSTPTTQANVQLGMVFEATAPGKGIIVAFHAASGAALFMALGGLGSDNAEGDVQVIAPTSGTISKIRARRNTAPGGIEEVTYTLRVNGVDSALSCTISGSDTQDSGAASVAIAAGDLLSIGVTISDLPASSVGGVSLDWAPTVDGESLFFGTGNTGLSNAAARYMQVAGVAGRDTEADAQGVAPIAFTARALRARTVTAPGSGKSWTYALRKSGASQDLTCTIADAATSAADATHSVAVAEDDLVNILIAPTATPTATASMTVSMVAYVPGAAPPSGGRNLLLMGVG